MQFILDVIQCEQVHLTVDGAPPPAVSTSQALKQLLERTGLELIEYSSFQMLPIIEHLPVWIQTPDGPKLSCETLPNRRTKISIYSQIGMLDQRRAQARQPRPSDSSRS